MTSPSRHRALTLFPSVVAIGSLVLTACTTGLVHRSNSTRPLPLQPLGEIALPGNDSRFDYATVDSDRGLLFIAHLGASEMIQVDLRANAVVRTVGNLSDVHGVMVVPALHRVFATATGDNQMVSLDEDTGSVFYRTPTGEYPDGLAYDPTRDAVWTTNEAGGSETVIAASDGTVRGTVPVGGEAGNVAYDTATDRMLVAVQGRNDLAVIDPGALSVSRRIPLPGCDHPHGLALDPVAGTAFVACDGNATLLSVDIPSGRVTGTNPVGEGPDVLAYDAEAQRLYVAAESGEVTTLDRQAGAFVVTGSAHLANAAHVVALDPTTHRSYYPVPSGSSGHPALLEAAPTQ
jgi:DNA-binding beta-propeller fold protein YncE